MLANLCERAAVSSRRLFYDVLQGVLDFGFLSVLAALKCFLFSVSIT